MLKVTVYTEPGLTRLLIEGRLVQDETSELTHVWLRAHEADPGARIEVDLSDLTYLDQAAQALLVTMCQQGVHLTGVGTMTRALIHQVSQTVALQGVAT